MRAIAKFCEHEQASTRLYFASKSSKGKILRAVEKLFDHSIPLRMVYKDVVFPTSHVPRALASPCCWSVVVEAVREYYLCVMWLSWVGKRSRFTLRTGSLVRSFAASPLVFATLPLVHETPEESKKSQCPRATLGLNSRTHFQSIKSPFLWAGRQGNPFKYFRLFSHL